jgi:hypothetical protein
VIDVIHVHGHTGLIRVDELVGVDAAHADLRIRAEDIALLPDVGIRDDQTQIRDIGQALTVQLLTGNRTVMDKGVSCRFSLRNCAVTTTSSSPESESGDCPDQAGHAKAVTRPIVARRKQWRLPVARKQSSEVEPEFALMTHPPTFLLF